MVLVHHFSQSGDSSCRTWQMHLGESVVCNAQLPSAAGENVRVQHILLA